MHYIGYYFGMQKQIEILILTLFGIGYTIYDISIANQYADLQRVWDMKIDKEKISQLAQFNLKYFLCGIILTRAWSAFLYLASYLVMLWPIFYVERPKLLIPWLAIGAIRSIGTSLLSFLTGCYICITHDIFQRPACADFALSMFIDFAPSYYIWFLVLSFYHELKILYNTILSQVPSKLALESEIKIRRKKVRSMADGMYFKHHHCPIDEDRHLISVSTIENLVQQLTSDLKRKTTRSLDSLLGVKAAEAEKEELMNLCDELPCSESGLTIKEKTLKLFKLTSNDILSMKKNLKKAISSSKSFLDVDNVSGERGTDETSPDDDVKKTAQQTSCTKLTINQTSKLELKNSIRNLMSDESETEIGSVLNYSLTSLVPKLSDGHKGSRTKRQSKESMTDFACQVCTLSRSILHSPPAELLKPSKDIKTLVTNKLIKKAKEGKRKLTGCYNMYVKGDINDSLNNSGMSSHSLFKTDGYATAYSQKISTKDTFDQNLLLLAKNLILNKLKGNPKEV